MEKRGEALVDLCEPRQWLPLVSLAVIAGAIPLGRVVRRLGTPSSRAGVLTLVYVVFCYGLAFALASIGCAS